MTENHSLTSPAQETNPAGRIYWLDVARTVAIVSITLNHAVNRTFNNYSNQMEEFYTSSLTSSLLKVVTTVFSHLGVPLFLMISGALLLSKRIESARDIRQFYRHNLLGLLITSEIWYAVMYWFIVLCTPGQELLRQSTVPQLIWGMVKTMLFIDQLTLGSMWYIPVILCLYTVIPFFSLVLRKIPLRSLTLPALVILATMLVHDANGILIMRGAETEISLALRASNVFSLYMLYVLAGYWVKQGGLGRIPTAGVAAAAVLSFAGICALQLDMYRQPADYLLDYDFTGYIVCAALTFELIRRGAHLIKAWEKPVCYLARISFAIYFIHIIIMTCLIWYTPASDREWLQMLYLETVSVGGSIVVIALFSRVPVLRRYALYLK
ncbi:MAG: acyltransferase [Oscillospiraceae bacterium]|nr:acyltransferase [Oscillospiraceae bacterium]